MLSGHGRRATGGPGYADGGVGSSPRAWAARRRATALRSSGMRAIWLRMADAPHTGEAEPDFIIHDLRELPLLLDRLG